MFSLRPVTEMTLMLNTDLISKTENFREDLKNMIFGNIPLTNSALTRVTDQ